jgi:hypothetical protein
VVAEAASLRLDEIEDRREPDEAAHLAMGCQPPREMAAGRVA